MMKMSANYKTLATLLLLYSVMFIYAAADPVSEAVWFAEIVPVVGILAIVVTVSRYFQFSKTAYILMFVWMFLHTLGAKYTFAEVPFDWFNNLIDSERNNFDRFAHFSIGFFAYPIAEYLFKKQYCNRFLASLFGLLSIMSVAAGYEVIEWWYAELAGGEEGIAFLGSQGDVWDAQKDMLCDTLGALSSLLLLNYQNRNKQ